MVRRQRWRGGRAFAIQPMPHTARLTINLSSKVNLPHAIKFRALRGTNLVTLPSNVVGATGGWAVGGGGGRGARGLTMRSQEYGTCKTVEAGFRPWLSGKRPYNLLSCSVFARQAHGPSAEVEGEARASPFYIFKGCSYYNPYLYRTFSLQLFGHAGTNPDVTVFFSGGGGRWMGRRRMRRGRRARPDHAIPRIWHMQDSRGRIPALAFR